MCAAANDSPLLARRSHPPCHSRPDLRRSRLISTASVVATLTAGTALYWTAFGGFGPRIDRTLPEATGAALAQQALALLKPGGQVIVITRDTRTFKNPATDIQLASFRKTIRQARAVIRSTLILQVDPLRPVQVPPEDFFDLIRKSPRGDVIVSFMGPPLLTMAQLTRLREVKPAIVAFCSGSLPELVDLSLLFDQGLLHAAVVAKRDVGTVKPRNRLESFNRSFLAVTATNLAALSAPPGASP